MTTSDFQFSSQHAALSTLNLFENAYITMPSVIQTEKVCLHSQTASITIAFQFVLLLRIL